jgi:undecaprenyl-diphosphatase
MARRHLPFLLAILVVPFVAMAVAAAGEGALPGDAEGIRLAQELPFRLIARFFERPVDEYLLPAAAVGGTALALWRRRLDLAVTFVLSWATLSLNTLAKTVVERPRPAGDFDIYSTPDSWSYPSGHAYLAVSVAIAWAFAAFELADGWRRWLIVAVAIAVALLGGFSRTWLGVHWPSDVLGGWLLALIVMIVAREVSRLLAWAVARRWGWPSPVA